MAFKYLEQFVTRMEEFPLLQIQAIYERSLNFEVLALKQTGLIYFIPGHRSGLYKFFLCDYHTFSTKHCITLAVGLLLLLSLLLFIIIIIVSKQRFSLPFVLFFVLFYFLFQFTRVRQMRLNNNGWP